MTKLFCTFVHRLRFVRQKVPLRINVSSRRHMAISHEPAYANKDHTPLPPLSVTMNVPKAPASIVTHILPVEAGDIGTIESNTTPWIEDWSLKLAKSQSANNLQNAAHQLREKAVPVAFPTETVYGLGADATRDDAVKAIYSVKGRPSDNPLIVHFASIKQIRQFISNEHEKESIPSIYNSLIEKFWPGPLTILLPLPSENTLAPSVTVGLKTFGARIPHNPVALALLRLANVPIAAPSANASTKPSPTTAKHVAHDLDGRISIVLDGGPCNIGVESTVVDGLCSPPAILRPGGISIEQLRSCNGWEHVTIAYTNVSDSSTAPRAPGMKYKHYSPKAKVILFEDGQSIALDDVKQFNGKLGIILTKKWRDSPLFKLTARNGIEAVPENGHLATENTTNGLENGAEVKTFTSLLSDMVNIPPATLVNLSTSVSAEAREVFLVDLGSNTRRIAQGFFAALRDLDLQQVDTILVEGIDETEGDLAAAIMNRLRKAAETKAP